MLVPTDSFKSKNKRINAKISRDHTTKFPPWPHLCVCFGFSWIFAIPTQRTTFSLLTILERGCCVVKWCAEWMAFSEMATPSQWAIKWPISALRVRITFKSTIIGIGRLSESDLVLQFRARNSSLFLTHCPHSMPIIVFHSVSVRTDSLCCHRTGSGIECVFRISAHSVDRRDHLSIASKYHIFCRRRRSWLHENWRHFLQFHSVERCGIAKGRRLGLWRQST